MGWRHPHLQSLSQEEKEDFGLVCPLYVVMGFEIGLQKPLSSRLCLEKKGEGPGLNEHRLVLICFSFVSGVSRPFPTTTTMLTLLGVVCGVVFVWLRQSEQQSSAVEITPWPFEMIHGC